MKIVLYIKTNTFYRKKGHYHKISQTSKLPWHNEGVKEKAPQRAEQRRQQRWQQKEVKVTMKQSIGKNQWNEFFYFLTKVNKIDKSSARLTKKWECGFTE